MTCSKYGGPCRPVGEHGNLLLTCNNNVSLRQNLWPNVLQRIKSERWGRTNTLKIVWLKAVSFSPHFLIHVSSQETIPIQTPKIPRSFPEKFPDHCPRNSPIISREIPPSFPEKFPHHFPRNSPIISREIPRSLPKKFPDRAR